MAGILDLSVEMIIYIILCLVDIPAIHAFQMTCHRLRAVIDGSTEVAYKIDLIRAGYKECSLHPDYRREPLALIHRRQAIRRYIRAWEDVDFSADFIKWADSSSKEDKDEWLKSDLSIDNGVQNTECYSGRTVAMIKIDQHDSFRFIRLPIKNGGAIDPYLSCSQEKVMASVFCISEERELLIFLDSEVRSEEDDGYYPRVHVRETESFGKHPHAAMEELEREEVDFGEPIGIQIFGDWVGILFQHDTPFRSVFHVIPGPELDSTLMIWDYIHGNVLGSLTFTCSEHTVYGFELLDTDCLIVLNSGASGGVGIASIMLYHIAVNVDHRATFTCAAVFQLPVVRSSIIPCTRLTFATTRTSHVFPHSPDAPHTTDVSLTKFKPFYLTPDNHVVSVSWRLFHGTEDAESSFLIFVRAPFFMNVVRQFNDSNTKIHPWSSWGETNTRVLINNQRFQRSRYHQAYGPRFIHMGPVSENSSIYSAVLDFGLFAPKNRSDTVADVDIRDFESSPLFPSVLCTKFGGPSNNSSHTGSYYVSCKSPTVIRDDIFVQPVSSSLPYSVVVVDLEYNVNAFAMFLGKDNVICRSTEDIGLSSYLVRHVV